MIGKATRFGYSLYGAPRGDLSVRCPACGAEAVFTSPYGYLRDEAAREAAESKRLSGVQFGGGFAYERFPDVFPWRDPNNPYVHQVRGEIWGVVSCGSCAYRKKHRLNWPADAFWRVELPVGVLWAFTREDLVRMRNYVSSDNKSSWAPTSLRRIPREFLLKRNRERVLRGIDEVLGAVHRPSR